eukprot:g1693.t1
MGLPRGGAAAAAAAVVAVIAVVFVLVREPAAPLRRRRAFHVLDGDVFVSADDAVTLSLGSGDGHGPIPVVFRGVDTKWTAQRRWTPEFLSQHIPSLSDVVVLQDGPEFWYEEKTKELNLNSNVSQRGQRHVARMETRAFFGNECEERDHFLWHSSGLGAETREPGGTAERADAALRNRVVDDIRPIAPFVVNGELMSANAWLGCGSGITTRLHYDMSHNIFVQIYGRKRFTLVPACSQPQHPFTSYRYLHPANTSTMDRMMSPPRSGSDDAIEADNSSSPCQNYRDVESVILQPGDVLYLPPLMYHRVESLDQRSISVNIWSRSEMEIIMDKALYGIALPFDDSDPRWATDDVFRAANALAYLEHVLTTVSTLEEWFAARWSLFGRKTEKWQTGFRAIKLARQSKDTREQAERQRNKFTLRAKQVRSVFKQLSATHARILTWNFADSVITFSLGDNLEQTGDAVASWVDLR